MKLLTFMPTAKVLSKHECERVYTMISERLLDGTGMACFDSHKQYGDLVIHHERRRAFARQYQNAKYIFG